MARISAISIVLILHAATTCSSIRRNVQKAQLLQEQEAATIESVYGAFNGELTQPQQEKLGAQLRKWFDIREWFASPKCAKDDETFEHFTGCKEVRANNLTFDCRFGPGTKGNVMLLHGFPEWSAMYVDLMRALSEAGYQSVACNQRGYSPGASPDNQADYNYNHLRDDIFAVATAVGFEKFHLVTHDHGAVLGWWTAGSDRGAERIQSFTGMSVPHADAFSAGLFGPNADPPQQMASQYFSMFTLPHAASLRGGFWTNILGRPFGFSSQDSFQKALWWYNGALDAGALAEPPVMSAWELTKSGYLMMAMLRLLFREGPANYPIEGGPATSPTGPLTMPAMYICGSEDSAILCKRPFALKTIDYVPAGKYKYLEVVCGHDPLNCGSNAETQKVIDGVVSFISVSVDGSMKTIE